MTKKQPKKSETKSKRVRAERLNDQAFALLGEGKQQEAMVLFREAIDADPAYEWSYIGLGGELGNQGLISEQIALLQQGLAQVATAPLYDNLGSAYQSLEEYAEAIKHFKLALRIDPLSHFVWSNLGSAYFSMGKVKEAREAYNKALGLKPGYDYALAGLAWIAESEGAREEALKLLERAETSAQRDGAAGRWDADLKRLRAQLQSVDQWRELPTIQEMESYLNRFVQGQNLAKRMLVTAIYNHYLSVAYQDASPLNSDLGRYNALIFGPSGSGKTYMTELITKKLNVPLVIINATSLVQTGYIGKRVDSIMEDLLVASNFDVSRAERGIVFIDEIDKVRKQSSASGPDVSGEGVQNALLTMLEGSSFRIENEKGRFVIDSRKVLFIGAGAFEGIGALVKARLLKRTGTLGFGASSSPNATLADAECLSQVTVEDLEAYGMTSQLAGRFSAIAPLSALSRDDLRQIMVRMENSVLEKQRNLFRLHGISLDFTETALEAILDLSVNSRSGARGLRSALARALSEASGEISSYVQRGICRVTITDSTVRTGAGPLLESISAGLVDDSEAQKLRREAFGENAIDAE